MIPDDSHVRAALRAVTEYRVDTAGFVMLTRQTVDVCREVLVAVDAGELVRRETSA